MTILHKFPRCTASKEKVSVCNKLREYLDLDNELISNKSINQDTVEIDNEEN